METQADWELWSALVPGRFTEEDSALAVVDKALKEGADPNLCDRAFQEFSCALGRACHRAWPQVVQRLLDAGACVQWPGEEDVPVLELTGEEDVGYDGLPLDPLGVVLDWMSWELCENSAALPASQLAREMDLGNELVDILLRHGAEPFRPDPATARSPVENFLMTFVENNEALLDRPGPVAEGVASLLLKLALWDSPMRAPLSYNAKLDPLQGGMLANTAVEAIIRVHMQAQALESTPLANVRKTSARL